MKSIRMSNSAVVKIRYVELRFIQDDNFESKSKILVRIVNKVVSEIRRRFTLLNDLSFADE